MFQLRPQDIVLPLHILGLLHHSGHQGLHFFAAALGYFTIEVRQGLMIGRGIPVGAVQNGLDPADRSHHFLTGGDDVARRFQIVELPHAGYPIFNRRTVTRTHTLPLLFFSSYSPLSRRLANRLLLKR